MKNIYFLLIFIFWVNFLSAADYSFKSNYNSTDRTHTEYVIKGSTCKFQVDNTNSNYYADWKVNDTYVKNQDEATWIYDPQIEITINSYTIVKAEIRHDGDYAYKETHIWYVNVVQPDLEVISYSLNKYTFEPGELVTFSCTIKNTGQGDAGSSRVGYYLSKNSTWDSSDTFLDYNSVSSLSAGETSNESAAESLPSNLSDGTYYILFKADYRNNVNDEESESNNVEYKKITITTPKPDLIVQSPSVTPTTANSGDKVSVSCTVKNQGEAKANFGILVTKGISYYLSTNNSYSSDDVYLGKTNLNDFDAGELRPIDGGSYTIPSGTSAGTYYIVFYVDQPDNIDESSESNNINYKQITVTTPKPDLIVHSPSVTPITVNSGDKVSVSCTVKNQGEAKANFGILVTKGISYYLSTNNSYSSDDIYLGNTNLNDFDAGESRFIDGGSYTISSGTSAGTYYIVFYVDQPDNIDESDETNNTNYSQITYDVPKPDLIVQSPSATPTTVNSGDKVSVSCTVKNQGKAKADFGILETKGISYYLSNNTSYSSDDVYLGKTNLNDFDAGELRPIDGGSYTIPSGTSAGTYYIVFYVDQPDNIDESSESNNINYKQITVTTPKPDLIVHSPSVTPITVNSGDKVSVSCTVKNQGEAKANFGILVTKGISYYLSTNNSYSSDDIYLGKTNLNDFDAGESRFIDGGSYTIPSGTSAGTYYIVFYVDQPDNIDESSESNNTNSISLSIQVKSSDLSIVNYEIASGKYEFIPNENIEWNCSIKNIGQENAPKSTLYLYWSKNSDSYDPTNYLSSDEIEDPSILGTGGPDFEEISKCSGNFKLPTSLTNGTYYIHFVVDPDKIVDDNNRNNNHISCRVEIVAITKPDLIVNTSSISENEIMPGNNLVISCTIKNKGNEAAGRTKVGYYLSSNDLFDADDIKLGFDNISPLSGVSTSSTNEIEYSIPNNLSTGQWNIIIKADNDNQIAEEDEYNNLSIIPIEILSSVDLEISDFYVKNQNISAGGNIDISCEIANSGNTNSEQSEFICYLSEDLLKDDSDIELGKVDIPAIEPERTIQTEASFKLPSSITSTNWYLIGILNSQSSQNEISLNNNIKIIDVALSGSELKQTKPLISEKIYSGSKAYFYTSIKSELPENQAFTFALKGNINIPCGGEYIGNNILQCWIDLSNISSGQDITIELPSQIILDNKPYSLNTDLLPYQASISKMPIVQTISVFAGGSIGANLSLGSVPVVDIAVAKVSVGGNAGMQLSFTRNNAEEEFISRSFNADFGAQVKSPSIDVLNNEVEIGTKVSATAMGTIGQTVKFDNYLSDEFIKKAKAVYILETFSTGGVEINPFVGIFIKALQKSIQNEVGEKTFNDLKYSKFYGIGIESNSSVGFTLKQPKISLLDVSGKKALYNTYTSYNDGTKLYSIRYASRFTLSTLKFGDEVGNLFSFGNGSTITAKAKYSSSTGFNSLNFSYKADLTDQISLLRLTKAHYYEFEIPKNVIYSSLAENEFTKSIESIFQYGKQVDQLKIGANYFSEKLDDLFKYNPTNLNADHITFQKTISNSLFVEKGINIDLPKIDIVPGAGVGLDLGFYLKYSDELSYPTSKTIFINDQKLPIYDEIQVSDNIRLFDFSDEIKEIMEGALLLVKDQFNSLIEKTEDIINAGKDFFVETTNKACKAFGILSTEGKLILRALDPTTETVLKSAAFTEPKAITAYSSKRVVHPNLKSANSDEDESLSTLYIVSDNYNVSLVNNFDEPIPIFDSINLSISIDPAKMLELEFSNEFKSLAHIYYYDADNLQWVLQNGDLNPDPDTVSVKIDKSGSYAIGIEINTALDNTAPDIYDYNPRNGDSTQSDTKFWAKIYESRYGAGIDFSKTKLLIDDIEMDAVWDPVNSILSYGPDNSFSNGTHKFSVITVDYNGNMSEINSFFNNTITGNIESEIAQASFDCYPNPVSTNLNISVSLNRASNTLVDIYNINGQKIKHLFEGKLNGGKFEFTWNRMDSSGIQVKPGLYFVRLKVDNEIFVKKIIVQ